MNRQSPGKNRSFPVIFQSMIPGIKNILDLLRVPVVETLMMARLLELEIIAKEEIQKFKKKIGPAK